MDCLQFTELSIVTRTVYSLQKYVKFTELSIYYHTCTGSRMQLVSKHVIVYIRVYVGLCIPMVHHLYHIMGFFIVNSLLHRFRGLATRVMHVETAYILSVSLVIYFHYKRYNLVSYRVNLSSCTQHFLCFECYLCAVKDLPEDNKYANELRFHHF